MNLKKGDFTILAKGQHPHIISPLIVWSIDSVNQEADCHFVILNNEGKVEIRTGGFPLEDLTKVDCKAELLEMIERFG